MKPRPPQRLFRLAPRAGGRPGSYGALRLAALAAVLLGGAATLPGCKTSYNLEDRDTPTQVVVETRGGAAAGAGVAVVVYVGDRKGFDGTVRLDGAGARESGPVMSLRAGDHEVSVLVNGRAAARLTAAVKHRSWILVRLQGDNATISVQEEEAPGTPR